MTNILTKTLQTLVGSILIIFSSSGLAKDYHVSEIANNLDHPWSIAFLPNNDMLVSERAGRLRIIRNGKLLDAAISGLPDIYVKSQGGLFDILIDPKFSSNQKIYLTHASGTRSANTLNVISARLENMSLKNVKTILTVSPTKDTPNHFGGRMALMADGTLLVTHGDGFNYREKAQTLDNMFGKILRINTDGSIPIDNPFIHHNTALPEIYSYGHRNPQAILLSKNGKIWSHEHGPKGGDELNLIKPGLNYGWPAITFGVDYSGAIISPYTSAKGMEQPVTQWTPSIAPSGMTEYQGEIFPQWKGNLFVTALAERSVHRLTLKGNKVIAEETILTELKQRIRDIRTGPDGYLYVLTDSDNGSVLKLSAP